MSKTPKHMELTIFLTLLVLFLGAMLALTLDSAREIQRIMVSELKGLAGDAVEEFRSVHESLEDDSADITYTYQEAMADNSHGLKGAYPVQTVSFVTCGGMGQTTKRMVVQSRNALLVEIQWNDGSVQKIPMTFPAENSADVAQLLYNSSYNIAYEATMSWISFTGYWQDDFFYLHSIKRPYFSLDEYISPVPVPEDVELETLQVACAKSADEIPDYDAFNRPLASGVPRTAKSITIKPFIKSYAGDSYKAPFAEQWEKADELIKTGFSYNLREDQYDGLGVKKYRLTETVVHQYCLLDAVGEYKDQNAYICYHYMARFSPLELAVKELFSGGAFYVVLILFVLAAMFVYTTYYYVRNQEQRQLRDEINRQKQALEYARGAEESRRQMTSAIAHELKTPIAVLSSYAEALQENIDQEKQAHYLSVIRVETDKMDRMVLELLDLSRLEAGKYKLRREAFDLEELTKETLLPLQEQIAEKNLNVTYQVVSPVVEADRFRMGQIIENFMTNAIRHTPVGGKIIIRIGNDRETFSVENQGSRIPNENLQKVWETFWQGDASRNERGSGLGLSICRSIVQLHGGTCKAENTGFGVRFSVSLSEHMKLFQTGRIPQETLIELDYPIAQQYTNVEKVFENLGLMPREALRREISEGNVLLGADPVKEPRQKLYHGYVLKWKEYRITIRQDEEEKARALLMERMRPGGLGNPCSPTGWGGYIKR